MVLSFELGLFDDAGQAMASDSYFVLLVEVIDGRNNLLFDNIALLVALLAFEFLVAEQRLADAVANKVFVRLEVRRAQHNVPEIFGELRPLALELRISGSAFEASLEIALVSRVVLFEENVE